MAGHLKWLVRHTKYNGGKEKGEKKEGKKKMGKKKEKRVKKIKGKRELRGEGAEEDRMKNRKEKERKKSWDQVFRPKELATVLGVYL